MGILDQSKPILQYLKIKNQKFKNQNFANCTFIIHKNGNKTNIQFIIKLNSTSFMLNNIFCEMKSKKSYPLGGGGVLGEWGNCPNCFLEV